MINSRALTLFSIGVISANAAAFDHTAEFSKLPDDLFKIIEEYYEPPTDWYRSNYNMAKYSGYQELLAKHNGYLPTGADIVVLQAESNHTPDSIGDVKHLFDFETSNNHSEYVAGILSTTESYPLLLTRYSTFSPDLDNFHTADTADLRVFFNSLSSENRYPASSYDGIPLTPAKVLNISNTNGGSGDDLLKQFDQFVELNDMVACTAHSSLIEGNWTTSGMAYNSIVVGQTYVNTYAFDGAKINNHGSPRFKPDLIAHSKSYASSYSTPTVCSAAAMMLERVSVDPDLSNAWNSVVMKAMLMAGSTRFNYKASTEWGDGISQVNLPLFTQGEWIRNSDSQPTSEKYGAGSMNILSAYNILDAGEFDASETTLAANQGWDYANNISENQKNVYLFSLNASSVFSAVSVWHRKIDDDLNSFLPDYSVTIYDADNVIVAFSDNLTSNVELIEAKLAAGNYRMEVLAKSNGGASSMSYGLAWTTKLISPTPTGLNLVSESGLNSLEWTLAGDSPSNYKYRVEISQTPDFSSIETEVFTDNAYYVIEPSGDDIQRYYRVYTYPKDSQVAYSYPSVSVELFVDQDLDGLSDSSELEIGTDILLADTDGDAVNDSSDAFPLDASESVDTDNDGIGNNADTDDDGDSVFDVNDTFPLDASESVDTDNDGIGNNADTDDDGDSVFDVNDAFPLDASESVDTDNDGIGNNVDTDDDGDGIPDEWELANNLNPLEANDALSDLDGDGLSNLEEYLGGSNVAIDDVPPVLSAPSDLIVSSTGPLTPVDLGVANAHDVKDGSIVPSANNAGPFAPGRNVIIWSAVDQAGNASTRQQIVDVIPMVSFPLPQAVFEGESLTIAATLNGAAVTYPVTVPFTISGTAQQDSDHDISDGEIVIASGTNGSIEIATALDDAWEGNETIIVTMGTPSNAVSGAVTVHTATIKEENIAPTVSLMIKQNGESVTTVYADSGLVEISAVVADPNPNDGHTFDWSASSSLLSSEEGLSSQTFTFDPSNLSAGLYSIGLSVEDDGDGSLNDAVRSVLRVAATGVVLSNNEDSDGDGVVDSEEGSGDSDMDRIPDYLDAVPEQHHLPSGTGAAVIQTESGLHIVLGKTAFASGAASASIVMSNIDEHGGSGGGAANNADDDHFQYLAGIFDFEISGINAGGSIRIVLP